MTTDSWTSINNENFVAITVHWLDDSQEHGALTLCSNLLDCIAFNDCHTAINLCSLLPDKFEEWEIQDKLSVIISDNAHNIVAAIKKGNWRDLGCFAHTVNLIAQKGPKEIEDTLVKIRKKVEFFKQSLHALSKLHQTQEQMG